MSTPADPSRLGRRDSWDGVRAVVAGFGVSGFAAADNLLFLGADVTALDEATSDEKAEKATLLESLGGHIRLEPGATATLPDDVDVLVTSPGWRPDAPLLAQAAARGVPVWGEVELAWRLRDTDDAGRAAPWLAVTGTNGKTTTVQMLDSILRAAGLRSACVGNVGRPIVEAVMDPEPYDVFAVELSSFQLHYTHSMAAESAAVLNVAPDHLDWYPGGMADYAADKGRIFERVSRACVYNVADPGTEAVGGGGRGGRGGPGRSASPSACRRSGWSGSWRTSSPTGPSSRSARPVRPSCAPSPTSRPRRRTSSPTPWPPRRWPGPTASSRRPCATGCGPSVPTATGSPTSPSTAG